MTNKEGLTLIGWLSAAGLQDVKAVKEYHIKAWKDGEDPSEWKAFHDDGLGAFSDLVSEDRPS